MSDGSDRQDDGDRRDCRGVVLLITLVILVILSTLGYTLSAQVAARRHRDRYIVDYAQAQYACTSATKHALASLTDLAPQLISRPNEPDFSDVFALSEPAYQELLVQTTTGLASADDSLAERPDQTSRASSYDFDEDDPNSLDDDPSMSEWLGDAAITGPYGPPWPLVVAPTEFEIGSAKITVEIEDDGRPYDPVAQAPSAPTEQPAAERPVGGMGVHIVKRLAESFEYKNSGGKNVVKLEMKRAQDT